MTAAKSPRTVPFLYALFLLSGAAGLCYESVWSRYLGLFVGHAAYAQVLVLAIFLGGMSLGAALISRRARTIARPLMAYAVMEAVAGLIGLGFHDLFNVVTGAAYQGLLPGLASGPMRTAATWSIAALLILPQSILLGTTFPLMSAAVLRLAPAAPGRVLGWLYFTNSLGAAIGVLIAGFVLVERTGLPGVLAAAATANLLVALVAFVLARRAVDAGDAAEAPAPTGAGASQSQRRLLLWAAGLTAFASFCYEIDWIRMLSLVLGSATHSFELMLSAFILGLALGAFWIRRRSDGTADPFVQLGTIQIVMGVLAVATLPLYAASFPVMALLLTTVSRSAAGYVAFSFVRYLLCLVIMLPATFCAGMTLPLLTRALIARGDGEAAIGRVYAVNTLGSIVGVIAASLLLLPLLGLKGLAVVAGIVDIGVGIALLRASPAGARTLRWGVLAIVAVVVVGVVTPLDRTVLVSGVFRGSSLAVARSVTLPFYADGRTATVSLSESPDGFRVLATNGKADASLSAFARQGCTDSTVRRRIEGDQVTQLLLGMIPLAYHPQGGRAAVIGLGSGVTSHILLAAPALTEVVTVEIEPKMVEAAQFFRPANRRTFDAERSTIVLEDAKAYFASSNRKWDLIVSEPSNPWVSGVSGLFTVEFYRRIRGQMAANGVFAQWLQTYELDDDLVLSVLAAVHEVFPDYRVHQVGAGDLVLVASAEGPLPPPNWTSVLSLPALGRDLCHYVPLDASVLDATLLADRRLLAPAVALVGQPNSDYYPTLDLQAERRRFERRAAVGMMALGDDWLNATHALTRTAVPPREAEVLTMLGMRRESAQWRRTWQRRSAPPPQDAPGFLHDLRYDALGWDAVLAHDAPPADWRPWLAQFQRVVETREGGTAGWVDTTLAANAMGFAVRHGAPPEVLAVLAFRRAVQGWDDVGVLRAAGRLIVPGVRTLEWIGGDELHDGAVIAALRLGDHAEVLAWDRRTAPLARRASSDFRSRLLSGWIRASAGPASSTPP
ncbi:MAG: fused MFS/spermidine synthase [Gemmatimonadales bacterium]|nr:fused MFS/spermidine synthase [Gemmatimonadales bacterium]